MGRGVSERASPLPGRARGGGFDFFGLLFEFLEPRIALVAARVAFDHAAVLADQQDVRVLVPRIDADIDDGPARRVLDYPPVLAAFRPADQVAGGERDLLVVPVAAMPAEHVDPRGGEVAAGRRARD